MELASLWLGLAALLLSLGLASLVAVVTRVGRRAKRSYRAAAPPYSSWQEFIGDVEDLEVPVDDILERCSGRLPVKPGPRCAFCAVGHVDCLHAGPGTPGHCTLCADLCALCEQEKIRFRSEARRLAGSAPCPFCQELLERRS